MQPSAAVRPGSTPPGHFPMLDPQTRTQPDLSDGGSLQHYDVLVCPDSHPSRILSTLERQFVELGAGCVNVNQTAVTKFVARVVAKLGLTRTIGHSGRPLIVPSLGYSEFKTLPLGCWTELIPFCFDCWEPGWARWASFFRRYRIRLGFFTARQSAEYFQAMLPEMRSVWIPEAVDPSLLRPQLSLSDRSIDVLEFGRKYDAFHHAIRDGLAGDGATHLYEKIKGEIIFPTLDDFHPALGNSKISVCFPGSLSHPEVTGHVETTTLRYFESIGSRCVVLGRCPAELRDLFGFSPILEMQAGNELEQVRYVLKHVADLQAFVDRNYERFLEVGTWEKRMPMILRSLNQHAFERVRAH